MTPLERAETALKNAHAAGDAAAARKLAAHVRQLRAQPEAAAAEAPMAPGLARSALQGATFNFGDELEAGARALWESRGEPTFTESYGRNVGQIRESLGAFREAHPALAFGAEMAGALAVPGVGAAGATARGATMGAKLARGVALGAGSGALAGAGAAEGGPAERGLGALGGAVVGGGVGASLPLAGAAAARVGRATNLWRKSPGSIAPTVAELEGQAARLYNSARSAGVLIHPGPWQTFVGDVRRKVIDEGLDPTLHPRATAVLRRLEDAAAGGHPMTLEGTETLRRVIKDAAASQAPDERRLARIMIDRFDDWREALRPGDLMAGSTASIDVLPQARNLWSRAKKGEMIGELLERADLRANQFSQSGVENALRTEFRQLARDRRKMRTFTPDEQKAIRAVALGSPIANATRWLGKFAPRGIVSATLGGGAGYAVGGPVGSAAVLGAGELAREAAARMTRNRALAAQELALRGAPIPETPARLGAGMAARALTPGATIPLAGAVQPEGPPSTAPTLQQSGWRDPETGREAQFFPSLQEAEAAAAARSRSLGKYAPRSPATSELPMMSDGRRPDRAKLSPGQAYQLPNGEVATWDGEQFVVE